MRVDACHREATGGHLRACHRLPTCRELSDCFTALRVRRDASVRTARRCIAELHFIGRVRRTPLHWFAQACATDSIVELLDAGANPKTETEEGESALDIVNQIAAHEHSPDDHQTECSRAAAVLEAALSQAKDKGSEV